MGRMAGATYLTYLRRLAGGGRKGEGREEVHVLCSCALTVFYLQRTAVDLYVWRIPMITKICFSLVIIH